jgi:hypothetical protein
MDATVRERTRAYETAHRIADLDALEHARARAGLGAHPDACEMRMQAATTILTLIGRRMLRNVAEAPALQKPILSLQYSIYLASQLDMLDRRARNGGRNIQTVHGPVVHAFLQGVLEAAGAGELIVIDSISNLEA